MTERLKSCDATRVSAQSRDTSCSWRPRKMRYDVQAVRTPASSSVSKIVGTSADRCWEFMLKIVSTSWRLRPNLRDAENDEPYST